MTAEYLYGWLKGALDYFGLQWKDKGEIVIRFEQDKILASYDNETITLKDEGEM